MHKGHKARMLDMIFQSVYFVTKLTVLMHTQSRTAVTSYKIINRPLIGYFR